ncbi:IPT/TIG domain-containing protein [Draconibacterium sp.]|uniref:IPT/TIG domain-containing protein n=1 Tax=Draconibacterium sp. TaxID=1965318 RepID=UPI003569902C
MRVLLYFIVFVLFMYGCNDKEERDFPSVQTHANVIVEEDGVTVFGSLEGGWSSTITDVGFIYYLSNTNGTDYETVSLGYTDSGMSEFKTKIVRNLAIGGEYVVKAYLTTSKYTVYGEEQHFISKGGIAPVINSFSPQDFWIGDTITIRGQYFSDKNVANNIYFREEVTHPIVSSDSVLRVIVPRAIKTSKSFLRIEVAGKSSSLSENFRIAPPAIDEILPENVLLGESFKIKGHGLLSIKSLIIGQQNFPVVTQSDTSLLFTLTYNISPGSQNLKLMMLDELLEPEKQYNIVLPQITSVQPQIAWIDSVLTVKGTHLDRLTNFQIGGIPLQEITKTDSLVTLRVTAVFNSETLNARFRYNGDIDSGLKITFNMPVITSISPAITHAGETIELTGERFFYGMAPSIGMLTDVSENKAKLTLPWMIPAGKHTIDLSYMFDFSARTVEFTIPPIKIIDYWPKEIKRGDTVSVIVENLPENLSGYYAVAFDRRPGYVMARNGNELQCIVPYDAEIGNNPSLSVYVGLQDDMIENAFVLTEKWEKVDKNFAMSGGNCFFIDMDGAHYLLFQDQHYSSLKKFDSSAEDWFQLSRTDLFNESYIVTTFSIDNDLYFISYNSSGENLNYKYSISNNEWSRIAGFPVEMDGPFSFSDQGRGFVGTINSFFEYDKVNDSWITRQTLPTTQYEVRNTLNFSHENYAYLGFYTSIVNRTEYNEFWQYNMDTDEWIDLGGAPVNVYTGGSVFTKDNIAYIMGIGYEGPGEFKAYDLNSNKARNLTLPPTQWYQYYQIFYENGYVYFMMRPDSYSGWSLFKIAISELYEYG